MTLYIKGAEAPVAEDPVKKPETVPKSPPGRLLKGNEDPYGHLKKLTYLIVDDSRFSRRLIREALGFFGIRRLLEAEDGIAALEVLTRESVDLVLTDYEMPLVSGVDLTRMIRKSKEVSNPDVPVIFISGFTEAYRLEEAMAVGITEYVVKPFAPKKLLCHVVRALGVAHPALLEAS